MGDENKKDTKNTIENLKITKKKKNLVFINYKSPPLNPKIQENFPSDKIINISNRMILYIFFIHTTLNNII